MVLSNYHLSHQGQEEQIQIHDGVQCALSHIPFSCAHCYIGQASRCLNIRQVPLFTPHAALLTTTVLFQHGNKVMREIVEAFHVCRSADCLLNLPEVAYLNTSLVLGVDQRLQWALLV